MNANTGVEETIRREIGAAAALEGKAQKTKKREEGITTEHVHVQDLELDGNLHAPLPLRVSRDAHARDQGLEGIETTLASDGPERGQHLVIGGREDALGLSLRVRLVQVKTLEVENERISTIVGRAGVEVGIGRRRGKEKIRRRRKTRR